MRDLAVQPTLLVQHANDKIASDRRSVNGTIALRVPLDVIKAKCAPYRRHGKPWHRPAMQNLDDYDIIQAYGAEYRGIAGYYLLATDVRVRPHVSVGVLPDVLVCRGVGGLIMAWAGWCRW
jgi:hypothetical protein